MQRRERDTARPRGDSRHVEEVIGNTAAAAEAKAAAATMVTAKTAVVRCDLLHRRVQVRALLLPLHTSGKISCIALSATATTAAASLAVASASFTLAPGIILRRFKGLRRESNITTARTPLAVHPELSGFHHASKAAITASRGTAG